MRTLLCILMLLALLAVAGLASDARADVVARWTFDEAASLGKDSSGNGFDLTITGSVAATEGKKGGAIRLGPEAGRLSAPYDARLNPPDFAVAAWVKTAAPTTDWQVIASGRDTGAGFILYATNDGCYGFFLGFQTAERSRMSGPSSKATTAERAIAPGEWVRLVGTFQATATEPDALGNYKGVASFYMNGKLVERMTMDYKPNFSVPTTIGAFANGRAAYQGEIDEVSIWNSSDPVAPHEGMEVQDPTANMSPEERKWTASLRVSATAMQREYYREAYAFVPDRPDKPNVLLVGDSISEGYTRVVRRLLAEKADVYRIPQNGGNVVRGVESLVDSKNWLLGKDDWAVIHFNFGLHDLVRLKPDEAGKVQYDVTGTPRHTLEQYEEGLDKIVTALKATGAKVICGLTTPVPENSRGRVNGEEIPYNEVAKRVVARHGIAVNDLHAPIAPIHEKVWARAGDVHYNDEGSELLGKLVAEKIEEALAGR